jgi:3'(2'), 5'-bisphosphate nucleotidase
MTAKPWKTEFDVALAAVREGALLAREIRRHFGDTCLVKADRSPVTIADFAVQALVAHRLNAAFPADPIVAEEDAAALRAPTGQRVLESVLAAVKPILPALDAERVLDLIDRGQSATAERFWTLDPVDGTQGFVRGDQYVVALALIVCQQVVVGIIGCPALPPVDRHTHQPGWLACAVRDCGAWTTGLLDQALRPLHVSRCTDPRASRFLRSFEASHIDLAAFDSIIEALGVQTVPLLMDSQAKHALIAAGSADVLIRVPATKGFRDKIWDQAAGSVVIEEAGGRVTDLRGVPLDFGAGRLLSANQGVVASNRLLHDDVLSAIRARG